MAQGLGFCPAIMYHIEQIADSNAPSRKMHVAGFLAMLFCCQNSSVSPISDNYEGGHQKGLTITYRRRPVLTDVQTEDDCNINTQPGRLEWNVPVLSHRQVSFHIADNLIRQYCIDASAMQTTGAPPTQVMTEVYDLIVEHANILLKAVNRALVIAQATEFGVNTTTGSSTGKVININRNGNDFSLDDGIVEMMTDQQENEICGTSCLVGGGLFNAYTRAHALACCNNAGLNLNQAEVPPFFFDKDTQTIWGNNTVGSFAPGSVKFIGRNRYVGAGWTGYKGTSFFSTLPLPVQDFGCADDCLRDLVLDMQIRYNDCPVETDGGTIDRGIQVILSKQFALWSQPDNAFAATDELFGTNGILKYFITNTNYTGGAYAYPA
jgi:hypothetical protein